MFYFILSHHGWHAIGFAPWSPSRISHRTSNLFHCAASPLRCCSSLLHFIFATHFCSNWMPSLPPSLLPLCGSRRGTAQALALAALISRQTSGRLHSIAGRKGTDSACEMMLMYVYCHVHSMTAPCHSLPPLSISPLLAQNRLNVVRFLHSHTNSRETVTGENGGANYHAVDVGQLASHSEVAATTQRVTSHFDQPCSRSGVTLCALQAQQCQQSARIAHSSSVRLSCQSPSSVWFSTAGIPSGAGIKSCRLS
jgi:hypothetical protein